MDRWIEYNPNPKERRVGDCAIRACCKATGRSWDEVIRCAKNTAVGLLGLKKSIQDCMMVIFMMKKSMRF